MSVLSPQPVSTVVVLHLSVDLSLDGRKHDVKADVILLVQSEVRVTHEVQCVDDSSGLFLRIERQLYGRRLTDKADALQGDNLSRLHFSEHQYPAFVLRLLEPRSVGTAVFSLETNWITWYQTSLYVTRRQVLTKFGQKIKITGKKKVEDPAFYLKTYSIS